MRWGKVVPKNFQAELDFQAIIAKIEMYSFLNCEEDPSLQIIKIFNELGNFESTLCKERLFPLYASNCWIRKLLIGTFHFDKKQWWTTSIVAGSSERFAPHLALHTQNFPQNRFEVNPYGKIQHLMLVLWSYVSKIMMIGLQCV